MVKILGRELFSKMDSTLDKTDLNVLTKGMLQEIKDNEIIVPPKYLMQENTQYTIRGQGDGVLALGTMRNPSVLTYEQMNRMRNSGAIRFVLALKKMPITAIFRKGPGESWRVKMQDPEQAVVIEKLFNYVRMDYVRASLNALDYGFQPFEIANVRQFFGNELMLDNEKEAYYGYGKLKDLYPGDIELKFKKENPNIYDGFVQYYNHRTIELPPDKTIVVTHQQEYGNMYGYSEMTPMYSTWFWYEIVVRSMLRYMERVGQPIVVAYAPSQRRLIQSETGRAVDSLNFALDLAVGVSNAKAVALPSDVDPVSRNPMWRLEYLQDDQRGAQFREIIEYLNIMIMRSGLVPDSAITQSMSGSGSGSYAMAKAHLDVFMQTEEDLLYEQIAHINNLVLPNLVWWNFGRGTQAYLETSDIDRSQIEKMYNLMSAMLNVHPDATKIDFTAMAESLGFPVDESAESVTDIQDRREEEKSKLAEKTAKAAGPPSAPGGPSNARESSKNREREKGKTKGLSYEGETEQMIDILIDLVETGLENNSVTSAHKDSLTLAEEYGKITGDTGPAKRLGKILDINPKVES